MIIYHYIFFAYSIDTEDICQMPDVNQLLRELLLCALYMMDRRQGVTLYTTSLALMIDLFLND